MEQKQGNQYGDEKYHKGGNKKRGKKDIKEVWDKKKLFLDADSWISEVT